MYLLFSIPFMLTSFDQSNGQEWVQAVTQQAKQAIHVYGSGSLKDIAEQRIHDRLVYMSSNGMLTYNPLNYFFASIPYFSMFLLGAAAAKSRYLHEPEKHRKGLKRLWMAGLVIGIGAQVLYSVTDKEICLLIGAPFLMFFYVTTVVYLYHKTRVRTVLQSFSAVGRMAFTNYLMQSIVCTWIFIITAWPVWKSVPCCRCAHYNCCLCRSNGLQPPLASCLSDGPFEWLWRSATYLSWQPIAKKTKV